MYRVTVFNVDVSSGSALFIGIKHGRNNPKENPMKTWFLVDEYLEVFKERYRYTNCRQLTGVDVKTPEGMKKYFESIHDYACAEGLKFAIEKKNAVNRLE